MSIKDTANIGLSEEKHAMLREMTDNGIFSDIKDGYRLAVSIALNKKMKVAENSLQNRKNMYDVGGVDENSILKNSIGAMHPGQVGQEYKYIEKLADAGVAHIYENYDRNGSLDVRQLLLDDT